MKKGSWKMWNLREGGDISSTKGREVKELKKGIQELKEDHRLLKEKLGNARVCDRFQHSQKTKRIM
jgi:hypothetical protein